MQVGCVRRFTARYSVHGVTTVSLASSLRAAATSSSSPSTTPPSPSSSTASARTVPPLTVLSWSIDGSGHTHRGCRRRLTLPQRIPAIAATIRAVAPDVVALQDARPLMVTALTTARAPTPPADIAQTVTAAVASLKGSLAVLAKWRAAAAGTTRTAAVAAVEGVSEPAVDESAASVAADEGESGTVNSSVDLPPSSQAEPVYTLVGSACNGRCGEVQVYVRGDSPWRARLLPASTGVTVELSHTPAPVSTTEATAPTAPLPTLLTMTSVDLSYRGKSLAMGGQLLTSAAVSRDGSPFTLAGPGDGGGADPRARPKGQLDSHRAVALDFIARVTRPNVLVGNFFMGQAERMVAEGKHAYADAWNLAGSPTHQERTTNTFATHAKDRETNYFYFVPTAGVARGGGDAGEVGEGRPMTETRGTGETSRLPEGGTVVGTPLSLTATRTPEGAWVDCESCPPTAPAAGDGASPTGSDAWVSEQLASEGARPTVAVPEVAGRSQRCFIRRFPSGRGSHAAAGVSASAIGDPASGHDVAFSQVFRRCRVAVLRPYTRATLGPAEEAWHAAHGKLPGARRKGRRERESQADGTTAAAADDRAEEGVAAAPVPVTVPLSLSDQYPLLVFFS